MLCVVSMSVCAHTHDGDTVTSRTHQLGEVVVDRSVERHVLTSSAPLYVIGGGQFLRQGVTDIADALNRLPGITLRDYGGAGGLKTVSVRGFGAQHTGVSYDGVMLSECQSGQIDLSRYSLDNVGHISLTVGDNDDIFIPARNASSAAVLDISTLRVPTADLHPHLTAQVRLGSFGYVSPFVRYEQNVSSRLALSAVGEYVYAENDYPFTLQNITIQTKERRTNSRMNSGHGELSMLWHPSERSLWSAKLYYYDNDRQIPGQARYYTTVSRETLRDRNAFAQAGYRGSFGSKWSLRADAKFNWAMSSYKNRLYKDGVNDADYWQREAYTTVSVLCQPVSRLALDYAVDYAFNNLSSSLPTDTRPYRHTLLQSATAKWNDGRLTVIARLLASLYFNDAKLGAGSRDMRRLSPSLLLSYRVLADRELYLRASYKDIFRVPTFNESYFFHYGSPTLSPEKTDQYNVGVTWRGDLCRSVSMRLTADGYLNHVRDKIVAVPFNMFVWTNINVGRVRMMGLDLTAAADWRLNQRHALSLTAAYSHQDVTNRTNRESPYYGNQIAYVPRHTASASLAYTNPWVDVTLHGTGTSMRYANNEHYSGTDISGYCDLGLTLSHSFSVFGHSLELRGDIKNLLNKQYEVVRMYPMPRRSWQLTVRYKL